MVAVKTRRIGATPPLPKSGVTNSAASGFGEGGVATPRSPVA